MDDDAATLCEYGYLGRGSFVTQTSPEPDLMWTLVDLTETNDPDTGDIYSGLDRFGRVKDNRWYNLDSEEDIDRIQYGYDRAGNRIWRHNLVAASLSEEFDEIYYYDGVHRLKEMQRGTLNGGQTELTSKTFAQCWTLDSTGNWTGFREDDNGDNTWDLIQERTANGVNEITGLTNTTGPTWSTPAYSRAGNMTTIPTPQIAGLDWNTLNTDESSELTTDEWANLDASLTRSATYDAWNRLVNITDNDVVLSDYAYDGAKRRIVQRSYTEGVLSETRHYFYTQPTQWQVLEERLGTSPDAADAERQFAWGLRYIDDLIVRDRDTNADGTLDERLYACQDGNWNVTAIVDDSGAVQERYAYSAYGVPVFLTPAFATTTGSASDWETLLSSYRWDLHLRCYHVRNRLLLPDAGVWAQRDRMRYHDSFNIYNYAISQPIDRLDPSGEIIPILVAGVLIGGVLFWPDPAGAPDNGDHIPATSHGANTIMGGMIAASIVCSPSSLFQLSSAGCLAYEGTTAYVIPRAACLTLLTCTCLAASGDNPPLRPKPRYKQIVDAVLGLTLHCYCCTPRSYWNSTADEIGECGWTPVVTCGGGCCVESAKPGDKLDDTPCNPPTA